MRFYFWNPKYVMICASSVKFYSNIRIKGVQQLSLYFEREHHERRQRNKVETKNINILYAFIVFIKSFHLF